MTPIENLSRWHPRTLQGICEIPKHIGRFELYIGADGRVPDHRLRITTQFPFLQSIIRQSGIPRSAFVSDRGHFLTLHVLRLSEQKNVAELRATPLVSLLHGLVNAVPDFPSRISLIFRIYSPYEHKFSHP